MHLVTANALVRHLLSIPAGGVVSIARLKIDPVWNPIRNWPDFQQLLSGPEQIRPNKQQEANLRNFFPEPKRRTLKDR
jgi:hypothetical protein